MLNVSEKYSSQSFLLNDVAQNTTDCNFIYRGRQLRRVIIQLHYALFIFSSHLSLRSPAALQRFSFRRCSCMHSSWSYSVNPRGLFSLFFLSCPAHFVICLFSFVVLQWFLDGVGWFPQSRWIYVEFAL